MATITLEIPDELANHFATEEDMRRTVYEDFVIEQRQNGTISLGEAAKLLNITYTEFFHLLGQKGLSFINATADELDQSYQRFTRIMNSAPS
jgi:predicted HTH domain antitoxin